MCGFTDASDIDNAVLVGADAIGLNFYPKSKRYIDIPTAKALALSVPPFITTVGLFVDQPETEVQAVVESVPLAMLQFHGNESRSFCESFCRPYLKVIRVPNISESGDSSSAVTARIRDEVAAHPNAVGFLLDTAVANSAGGTGETFDWSVIPSDLAKPIVLAGGLTANNVDVAIQQVKPFAVDVSSGIELVPGRKDKALMTEFIASVEKA